MLRRFVLFLFAAQACLAQLQITPAAPVVANGATYRFTANQPALWSTGPGTRGTIDADGTYHAPSLTVTNALAGCQILPNGHIYATRIDNLPVHPRSADWINNGLNEQGGSKLKYSPSWGLNLVDSTTPMLPMTFYYTPNNNALFPMLTGLPGMIVESGLFTVFNGGQDRHVVSANASDCHFYEMYNFYNSGQNSGCAKCTSQSGISYGLTYDLPKGGSTDAAGMPLLPLSLRLDELHKGQINHALRFTRVHPDQAFLWPATASAYYGYVDGRMQMGARLRLTANFQISQFSPMAQVLLRQLKQYGIILSDAGTNYDIQTMSDIASDPTALAAIQEVAAAVDATNMEVVDESSLMISNGTGATTASEIVIATSTEYPTQRAQVPVVVQGVTVGVKYNSEVIQSGVTNQFSAWVNGTTNHGVVWSMSPELGGLSASGTYMAPTVSSPQDTVLKVSSVADPTASTTIALTVLPAGPINMVVGISNGPNVPKTAQGYGPDSKGTMWWNDIGSDASLTYYDGSYPPAQWPQVPDVQLYWAGRHSLSDWTHRFLLPNGNYRITLKLSIPSVITDKANNQFYLEAQGQIANHYFDAKAATNNKPGTPVDVSLPAVVTNGELYFTLRNLGPQTPITHYPPLLSAFSIRPDSTAPYITIDNPIPADGSVATGDTVQFYPVGWYIGNSVAWTLQGPGSIDATGIYHTPAIPAPGSPRVTVTATSNVDPSKSASVSFSLDFGAMSVSGTSTKLYRGMTRQLTALLNGVAYSNVTWSASVGTVDPRGTYQAPADITADTVATVVAKSNDDATRTASTSFQVAANADPIRINCGDYGYPVTDEQGNVWVPDYGFQGGQGFRDESKAIAGASPKMQIVYQSARYTAYGDHNFLYRFPLPNGDYDVTLKVADYGKNGAGHFKYDVVANGKKVLTQFDPDALIGEQRAIDRSFRVTVTKGTLELDFNGGQNYAIVNAIQILPVGASVPAVNTKPLEEIHQ